MATGSGRDPATVPVPLDRDRFLRALIRELAGTLEDVVGVEEAKGYFSVVGGAIGTAIDSDYRAALQLQRLDRAQRGGRAGRSEAPHPGRLLRDLGGRREDRARQPRLPVRRQVLGRPSMCMMTSNVFGSIAANNVGYAKVELQETIAQGHPGCRVVVYLKPTEEAVAAEGREYFAAAELERGAGG